jgi:hypothetical protein
VVVLLVKWSSPWSGFGDGDISLVLVVVVIVWYFWSWRCSRCGSCGRAVAMVIFVWR